MTSEKTGFFSDCADVSPEDSVEAVEFNKRHAYYAGANSLQELKGVVDDKKNLLFSITDRTPKTVKDVLFSALPSMYDGFLYNVIRVYKASKEWDGDWISLVLDANEKRSMLYLTLKHVLNPTYLIKAYVKSFGTKYSKHKFKNIPSVLSEEETALYDKFAKAIFSEPIGKLCEQLSPSLINAMFDKIEDEFKLTKGMETIAKRCRNNVEYYHIKHKDVIDQLRSELPEFDDILGLMFLHKFLFFKNTKSNLEAYGEILRGYNVPVFETLFETAMRRAAFKLAAMEEFKDIISVDRLLKGDFSVLESKEFEETLLNLCAGME